MFVLMPLGYHMLLPNTVAAAAAARRGPKYVQSELPGSIGQARQTNETDKQNTQATERPTASRSEKLFGALKGLPMRLLTVFLSQIVHP